MSRPIHQRLLQSWHRSTKAGHSLTPTQFLVLCSVIETSKNPAVSSHARAKHLHFAASTISRSLNSLQHLGLITLTPVPAQFCPYNQNLSRMPLIAAAPTPDAIALFKDRAGRKPCKTIPAR